MRGIVFSNLVAAIGAHSGALHDVIETRQSVVDARDSRRCRCDMSVYSSARIFNKLDFIAAGAAPYSGRIIYLFVLFLFPAVIFAGFV